MIIKEFDRLIKSKLDFESCLKADYAVNGLQVGNYNTEITGISFAVDASMESFRRTKEAGCNLLFVHHGLFWGKEKPLTGNHYNRIKYLIENDISLYAVHLPLDLDPELGNNIGICRTLRLTNIEPFGIYRGLKIGFMGKLPKESTLEEISDMVCSKEEFCLKILPFGSRKINTVGIVSGGAPKNVFDAIESGLDLFITGDASHEIYHECMESGINVIFGGHYITEIHGVSAVFEFIKANTEINTNLIDIPTGL
jgi:dinuclear metal center YbgI/SA1388 family protein